MAGISRQMGYWSMSLSPWLVWFLLIAMGSEAAAGMFGLGKKYHVQLFPVVEGRITQDGSPLSGVTVVREATYDDSEVQETVTDPDGRFSFPPWNIHSRTPGKSFVEDRIRQVIVAEYAGHKYLLWCYVTGRIDGEQVVAEKLRAMECDLNDEEIAQHFQMAENPDFTHNLSSVCRWGQMTSM